MQNFAARDFRLGCYIDPLGTSRYAAISGDIVLDIAPGPPARLAITTPRFIRWVRHAAPPCAPRMPRDVAGHF